MAYNKHNFISGNILYATEIKEMDDQIYVLTNDDSSLTTRVGRLEVNTAAATNSEVEEMLDRVFGN